MAILIKDEEADRLIRTLAERTGESITDAVKEAVRERLVSIPPHKDEITARKRRMARLIVKWKKEPVVDRRTADEIIGYNEFGHFDR